MSRRAHHRRVLTTSGDQTILAAAAPLKAAKTTNFFPFLRLMTRSAIPSPLMSRRWMFGWLFNWNCCKTCTLSSTVNVSRPCFLVSIVVKTGSVGLIRTGVDVLEVRLVLPL